MSDKELVEHVRKFRESDTYDSRVLASKLRKNNPHSISHELAATEIEKLANEIDRLKGD